MSQGATNRGPRRTCVGCRAQKNRAEMLRLVLGPGPDGPKVVWDRRRRRPGRGAWLCGWDCLGLALKKRALPRALRAPGELDLTDLPGPDETAGEIKGRPPKKPGPGLEKIV